MENLPINTNFNRGMIYEKYQRTFKMYSSGRSKSKITSDAIREYYEIQKKIDKERKEGILLSSALECLG